MQRKSTQALIWWGLGCHDGSMTVVRPHWPLAAMLAACALPLGPAPGHSAVGCSTDAMLVFDGSASMAELSFDLQRKTRIVDARAAVRDAMPDITQFRRVGLLTYGPGSQGACDNIDLRFGPRDNASAAIIADIDGLAPKGLTPLAASVRAASEALHYETQPGIVVLVTDGNETCGGRPCALGAALADTAADLTVHVIGFKVVVDFFSWDNPEQQDVGAGNTVAKCLADRTGGLYVSTETVDELADALRVTLGCALIGGLGPETQNAPRTREAL
ncbi:MAG: VWA domain-containing protein [Pseudomonadota bacterium]